MLQFNQVELRETLLERHVTRLERTTNMLSTQNIIQISRQIKILTIFAQLKCLLAKIAVYKFRKIAIVSSY